MNPTREQIMQMASWTLEDFQNDPLGSVEQVRELAVAYLSLQQERDAAVQDLETIMQRIGKRVCEGFCCSEDCAYPRGICCPKWRGPQPKQVLAPADQSAGEYADNPVLAQA